MRLQIAVLLVLVLMVFQSRAGRRTLIDMAGRQVVLPEKLNRIIPYDPKTSLLLVTCCGEKLWAICVFDHLSSINTPLKTGPMLKLDDVVVVTKSDLVSQDEREVFPFVVIKNEGIQNILTTSASEKAFCAELEDGRQDTKSPEFFSTRQIYFRICK